MAITAQEPAQKAPESESKAVKFPRTIRYRKGGCKIYSKKSAYPFYRVAWYVNGPRRVKQFAAWSLAKSCANDLVKDLAKGS